MGRQVTVSAKIPAELKERLAKLGVNLSGTIRQALQREVKRMEKKRLQQLADDAGKILQEIPADELVEAVRKGRETR